MVADAELLAFRHGYYQLLAGLLGRQPSAEMLTALRSGLPARVAAAKALHPTLGDGWATIAGWLEQGPPEQVRDQAEDEFTRLFVGPFETELYPYESYYLTGKTFDRPLAAVRKFLERAGIEKDPSYPEPEDSLTFELEVMRRLVARQLAPSREAAGEAAVLQATFLVRHLLVWGPAFADDLARAGSAGLYRGVGLVLAGFLALERDLVRTEGRGEPRSLEEARQDYHGSSPWRGPMFDPDTGRTDVPRDPAGREGEPESPGL
jgi:TorA maturation chaperone TorD